MFKKVSPNYRLASTGDGSSIATVTKDVVVDGVKQTECVTGSSLDLVPNLPPPSNFSLDAQLDAGVDLRPVESKLLSPSESKVTEFINKANNEFNKE